MQLRPTQDYIVIKPIERKKSETLIVIEDEGVVQGQVMAVGPGKETRGRRQPLDVRVGDVLRFKNHPTYQNYEEDGVKYVLIREPDVEGVLEETE